jgi:diaminopimelate decarboxylase
VKKYDTPVFVYDGNKIVKQFKRLEKAFSSFDHKINYACKALTNINILKLLKNQGAGLDTVSIEEVYLGLDAGYKPEDIIFTPNGVNLSEYVEAAKLGCSDQH